jgi:hypothetical protein
VKKAAIDDDDDDLDTIRIINIVVFLRVWHQAFWGMERKHFYVSMPLYELMMALLFSGWMDGKVGNGNYLHS